MPDQKYSDNATGNDAPNQGEKGGDQMGKQDRMPEDDGANRMTQDKKADSVQNKKSTLIGKRHTDMEQEGKY